MGGINIISIITCTVREHLISNIIENYTNQLFQDKELIIILNKDEMDINLIKGKIGGIEGITIYQLPQDYSLGECLNYGIGKAKYDVIAKFDDDDYYGPEYLTEAMNALKTTNASIVGKEEFFVFLKSNHALLLRGHGLSNKYVKHVSGATLVFEKSIIDKIKFPNLTLGEDTEFQKKCIIHGYRIYSSSRYNFAAIRENDVNEHTWKVSDKRLIEHGEIVAYTDDFKSMVIRKLDEI
ncbi:cellulose synthase/poly-beta-1,6-N-acetylglucosamine synthase-like glycosyltransferase [Neobacillus niacini]|uniref:glycosyltransferase n=1 Tax=Neobacillus driksii TaxID=3035913 RepID=UPI0027846B33|nr:glycosyltransferase [Neobacillus niacini]MDQ0970651.1 cellulose synthase/poly-beta-1,6-N-acetylglucosamine synthase-like glycosyltransferase [Neobacillus niacini]